jgi:murein tripeptide amidase MpaA
MLAFVEGIAGNSPLAREFRGHFRTHVMPLVNPDGVDLGATQHQRRRPEP